MPVCVSGFLITRTDWKRNRENAKEAMEGIPFHVPAGILPDFFRQLFSTGAGLHTTTDPLTKKKPDSVRPRLKNQVVLRIETEAFTLTSLRLLPF